MRLCSVDGCLGKHKARGMCPKHYERFAAHGSVDLQPAQRDPVREFWLRVKKGPDCWQWTASKYRSGYGRVWFKGKARRAHRVSYSLTHGPLAPDVILDHICRNRLCVNPAHLREVTSKQNAENRIGAARKELPRGVTTHTGARARDREKFRVRVMHNGESYFVGRFSTVEEAEAVAIAKRNELYTHNDLDRQAS